MSVLTRRELEFLADLRTSWPRLYWSELARLATESDDPRDAWIATPTIAPQPGRPLLTMVVRNS